MSNQDNLIPKLKEPVIEIPTPPAATSSISQATTIPSEPVPLAPEIPAAASATKQPATATDTMILKIGQENSDGTREANLERNRELLSEETLAKEVKSDGIIAKLSEKSDNVDFEEIDPSTLLPGLKTLKKAFSWKKDPSENPKS